MSPASSRSHFGLAPLAAPAALLLALLCPGAAEAQWPHWRGPSQNGVSSEKGLPSSWSLEGKNLAWKVGIGSRSTPVVLRDHLYLLTRGGEGPTQHEQVVCLAAEDGKVLWQYPLPVFLTDIPWNRVGWASPAGDPETGNVYAHGVQGLFVALDPNGKLLWSHSLGEEYGRFSGYGGRVETPVVDGDLVIISFLNSSWGDQARMWHRFVAFEKSTGQVRWWSSPGGPPYDTSYSTPVVAEVNGARLLIMGAGDGAVNAIKIATGEPVWTFRLSKRGLNSSVVVEGTRVFASHSEENIDSTVMGRVVAIDATGQGDVTKTKELWRIDGLQAGYGSPVLHEGRLYVVDNSSNLECIDVKDGKRLWKEKYPLGTVGKGSPVWGDGKIYVGEVNGRFHILKDGPEGCERLDLKQFQSATGAVIEINGSPAVAGGRVYFSTRDETYAVGPKSLGPPADLASSGPPPDSSRPEPPAPAHLQVTPAEVVVKPGETVKFAGRLYDKQGRFIKGAEGLVWSLKGLRGMSAGGEFTPQAEVPFQAGLVEAKAGELTGSARVRVIPPLPVRQDFEKIEPKKLPEGWLGMSPLKFQVVERDGSRVLQKLANDPKFMRADVFIGPPDWSGYTLQADVLGTFARRTLPDIGLTGCRYTLYLTKHPETRQQILRAVAWLPMPRVQKDVPFDWKPDVWYRMKMRVDPQGKAGVVRGKVWPRSEKEPEGWTLEMEDPLPTFSGSAGFTAFSPGITDRSPGPLAFFDNIEVTENKD
jgi:outer membrane protein assembly factor BamB